MTVYRYDNYSVEDFVWDEAFRDWVLKPDSHLTAFWKAWLQQHPEKEMTVKQAIEVVQSVNINMEKLSREKKEEIIAETIRRLDALSAPQTPPMATHAERPVRSVHYIRYSIAIAASLLVVTAGLWMLLNKTHAGKTTGNSYNELVKQSSQPLVETVNTSAVPLPVILSDSSRVTLQQGARISYAPSFGNTGKREVYLSGTAFFEITHNPSRPFLVHANGIITRVLGTSFKVQTDMAQKGVTVEVVTGRVQVYEQPAALKSTEEGKENGVILSPNQKVIYSGEKKVFETSLVEEPVPITKENKKITKEDFVFEDAPLQKVIDAMEIIYGIKVDVENAAILNCPFTGDISEQNLHRKFDAICQSTNTTYEIKGTTVYIKGQGCN